MFQIVYGGKDTITAGKPINESTDPTFDILPKQ